MNLSSIGLTFQVGDVQLLVMIEKMMVSSLVPSVGII